MAAPTIPPNEANIQRSEKKPVNVPPEWKKDNSDLYNTYLKQESGDLQHKKDLFLEALTRLGMKHTDNPAGTLETMPDMSNETRRQRRRGRIELYDSLLLLALGAEGQLWETWMVGEPAQSLWNEKAATNLNNDSIFKYILDIIHDDEEVMLKVYDIKTDKGKTKNPNEVCGLKAFWLDQSLKRYKMHFCHPVVDVLKADWVETKEEDQIRTDLLKEAIDVFKKKLSSHGISFDERSWRSRARLYWLLGLYRHAAISNKKLGSFKGFDYIGPIGILVQKMLEEDVELLKGDVEKKDDDILKDGSRFPYRKEKYLDEKKKGQLLGHLKVCRVLSWASAANDYHLMATVLKHNLAYMASDPECDHNWRKSWEEAWAMALWNAAYRGHAKVVKQLLECDYPYHGLCSKYFATNSLEPPLHVAVRKGYISVVDAFCSNASRSFNCHEQNGNKHTPLEVATILKKSKKLNDPDTKTYIQIQSILLQRSEVKVTVEESSNQRQLTVDSANAIMVGATLFAGITFGGWLQPPLGYNSYYQFVEPSVAAPPDSYESYMSIQGHKTIQVFAIFNSLSFFSAVASVIASIETIYSIQAIEDTYIANIVEKLQHKLKWAISMFITCVVFSLVAFASAGIAILPPIQQYQRNMYITIGIGGLVCFVFICKMFLFCIPRRFKRINPKAIL